MFCLQLNINVKNKKLKKTENLIPSNSIKVLKKVYNIYNVQN